MKETIEQFVEQEIRDILAKNKASIREMVKTSLLSGLRAAVQGAIFDLLKDLVKGSADSLDTQQIIEGNVPIENKDNLQIEADSKKGLESLASDLGPLTSEDTQQIIEGNVPIENKDNLQIEADSKKGLEPPTSDTEHQTLDLPITNARYLYCVVEGNEKMSFGRIGIEENEVYTIPYEDLSAVVHNSPAEPYKSEDEEIMKKWVMAHQGVLDRALEKSGAALPLGFDTIIQGDETTSPEENMKNWLKDDYDNLKEKMEKIRGRAEYGVQVFWDPKIIAKKIAEESPEIKKLDEEIRSKPKGLAYMYKQKLEDLIKKEMEKEADRYFKEFYEKIKPYADDLKVEKTKKAEDEKQMLMNLSCLLPKEASKKIGEELEKIDALDGFSVRYTGPWPAYSFV